MSNDEKVTFTASPINNGEFIPLVEIGSSGRTRSFVASDMSRVMDFPNMPSPPPPSAPHGHLEFEIDDDDQTVRDDAPPKFPKRYFCLRGSFIFYFDVQDVVGTQDRRNAWSVPGSFSNTNAQELPEFLNGPIGVIPLERTTVEFPPGGRRVFREHANTDATQGYEMMIRHVPARVGILNAAAAAAASPDGIHVDESATAAAAAAAEDGGGATSAGSKIIKRRAPAYLVMDSLGQRDAWAEAIRIRAEAYRKETKLRASGAADGNADSIFPSVVGVQDSPPNLDDPIKGGEGSSSSPSFQGIMYGGSRPVGGDISLLAGVLEAEEQKDIDEALKIFGSKAVFREKDWVHQFLTSHDESEGKALCEKLERWQLSIKKGLKGAVLEQYEYFVEASKEMTQIGREVSSLKELVQKQVETIEFMRRIEFDLKLGQGSINDQGKGESVTEDETTRDSTDDDNDDDEEDDDENEEHGSSERSPVSRKQPSRQQKIHKRGVTSPVSAMSSMKSSRSTNIPVWMDDVIEEISALVKEYRYSDATELLLKAKAEIKDVLSLNEKLTQKKLSKNELVTMQRILTSMEDLSKRMCERLSDGLRRRNEALKQTLKKERVDTSVTIGALVSPTALNDDSSALHLLVKLGRPQDAALAYAERRSILLNECLQERLICNTKSTNNADVVISAAQLSHSFFNALAMSVEGFLDLFSESGKTGVTDDHSESSSINTGSNLSNIPSNALAATCLWCDSELLKFAAVFGTKILGNLMLTPRDAKSSNKITEKIVKFETTADLSHLREQLKAAEEMGEYAAAGKLRKKIALHEQEEKDGTLDSNNGIKALDAERKVAVEIASKCIDQAFSFASESLNTIGLPLTPRLAEYLRTRLKGAETDIAKELEDKWDHVVFDWKVTNF